MKNKHGKFQYIDLADKIQGQIESGTFKLTDKLPSLRTLCRQTGYSMTTVFQAYIELEKRGMVEPRQRSGYFIKARLNPMPASPVMTRHDIRPRKVTLDALIHELTRDMGNPDVLKLGAVAVAPEYLPFKQLHKHLKSIPPRKIPEVVAGYSPPQGNALLRDRISSLMFPFVPSVSNEDIVITNGCTEALSLCLKAVCSQGDTVITESPIDPWLRQTLRDSRIFAIETPTDPGSGIDLDAVEKILKKETVSACIVNPNFQNPLGFVMPDAHKERLAEMLGKKKIPVIENDIYGELYFRDPRPGPLKKWDTGGNVMYCSSFSKTLAPGLRVGWVLPGRFREKLIRMKLNRSLISPTLNQAVVAAYLKAGGFPRHLRQLRKIFSLQHTYCSAAVLRHFPDSTRLTSPKGGLSVWIELPRSVNGSEVYYRARKKGISILPGFLCSGLEKYNHYIRLGYGGLWDKRSEQAIGRIGSIIKDFL